MKKIIRNNVIGFVLAGLLCGAVTVISASQNLSSSSVEYKEGKSISTALNELYAKENQLYKKYKIGDTVRVNNEDYYVIADSPRNRDYVTLLKAEALTVSEVNLYGGVGTANNHVNRYSHFSPGTAYNDNGYGGLNFYTSETCGYVNGSKVSTGCESENATNYDNSDVKYVVDNWAVGKFQNNELKEVNGYKARLIKFSELQQFYPSCSESATRCSKESTTPSWLFLKKGDTRWTYWTMTQYNNSAESLWAVYFNNNLYSQLASHQATVARPVINVYKTAIEN